MIAPRALGTSCPSAWLFVVPSLLSGCDGATRVDPRPEVREEAPGPGRDTSPPAPVRSRTPGPAPAVAARPRIARTRVDERWASDERVAVRRFIYRVTLRVPGALGVAPATHPPLVAELRVDTTEERLRAHFDGPAWPVDEGAQVRLRRDEPGAYVFDSEGGRLLGPGRLARWFQGGTVRLATLPAAGLRTAAAGEESLGGDLVCALIAEWSGQERDTWLRRCRRHGAPAVFRVGVWRAERTADVPLQTARRELRADHIDAPVLPGPARIGVFTASAQLRRLPPRIPRTSDADPAAATLEVTNEGPTTVIVTTHGVPVGWVGRHRHASFAGLVPGRHVVGALRPLGTLGWRPRELRIPAAITIR